MQSDIGRHHHIQYQLSYHVRNSAGSTFLIEIVSFEFMVLLDLLRIETYAANLCMHCTVIQLLCIYFNIEF